SGRIPPPCRSVAAPGGSKRSASAPTSTSWVDNASHYRKRSRRRPLPALPGARAHPLVARWSRLARVNPWLCCQRLRPAAAHTKWLAFMAAVEGASVCRLSAMPASGRGLDPRALGHGPRPQHPLHHVRPAALGLPVLLRPPNARHAKHRRLSAERGALHARLRAVTGVWPLTHELLRAVPRRVLERLSPEGGRDDAGRLSAPA